MPPKTCSSSKVDASVRIASPRSIARAGGLLPQVGSRERQLTNALARCRVDGIAECRNKRRNPRLTDSSWRRITFNYVDVCLIGSLVDAGDGVVIEVGLLNR